MSIEERRFKESPMEQGSDEKIARRLDTQPWGGNPEAPVTAVLKLNGVDVSADHLDGSAVIEDTHYIVTSHAYDLVKGTKYRLEVSWIYAGNTVEAFGDLVCSEE